MPNRWEMPPAYLQSGDPEKEAVSARCFTPAYSDRALPSYSRPAPRRAPKMVAPRPTSSSRPTRRCRWPPSRVPWRGGRTRRATSSPRLQPLWAAAGSPACSRTTRRSIPIAPGQFCCVQTHGPASVKFVDAPTAAPSVAGGFVIPSATAGKADCLAAGSAATYPPLGVAAGALQGGTALAVVDLDVPETV
jgi:hypothetical protein